ncbi:MAG: class I SAM-dependent methyltransferase [Leptospiraceae bacterium]|nr:class I SAM-dependent methyltransferase [Leptospiraceae bacterium]MDW8306271.1 class I SAM-dependent methyltransferase [Leptospiraceae bacterium]
MVEAPAYTAFAPVYDSAMAQVPYEKWAIFIYYLFSQLGLRRDETVVDLGCGTGRLTELLREFYPHIIGLDLSSAMLREAQQRSLHRLVRGNIQALPFRPNSLGAALATHDVVNYLENNAALLAHLREVYQVLKPKGYYLFDTSTEENVLRYYHKKLFREYHNGTELLWYNEYHAEQRLICSRLTFRNKKQIFCEEHRQCIFSLSQIRRSAHSAGFRVIKEFADYSFLKRKNARLYGFLLQKT